MGAAEMTTIPTRGRSLELWWDAKKAKEPGTSVAIAGRDFEGTP
jgi:hypothetical protein